MILLTFPIPVNCENFFILPMSSPVSLSGEGLRSLFPGVLPFCKINPPRMPSMENTPYATHLSEPEVRHRLRPADVIEALESAFRDRLDRKSTRLNSSH